MPGGESLKDLPLAASEMRVTGSLLTGASLKMFIRDALKGDEQPSAHVLERAGRVCSGLKSVKLDTLEMLLSVS